MTSYKLLFRVTLVFAIVALGRARLQSATFVVPQRLIPGPLLSGRRF